jgi:hypothetical protein
MHRRARSQVGQLVNGCLKICNLAWPRLMPMILRNAPIPASRISIEKGGKWLGLNRAPFGYKKMAGGKMPIPEVPLSRAG